MASRTTRAGALAVGLALVLAAPPALGAPASVWEPAQDVRGVQTGQQPFVVAGASADGTLVTAWFDPAAGLLRATRPVGGDWSAPEALPVDHVTGLEAVAVRPDGGVQVAYTYDPPSAGPEHRVQVWRADGSVGAVGLTNASDDVALSADGEGDVVAERVGSYDPDEGFDRLLHYSDGEGSGDRWERLPKLGADPRDVFVPGPGESVWAAGYDQSDGVLRVRRWTPRTSRWRVEWARDYPSGHLRKPLVTGLDLAVGPTGRVVVAFAERVTQTSPATVRVVTGAHGSRWTRARALQRIDVDDRGSLTAPVVALAGVQPEVAWTSTADGGGGRRDVRLARVGDGRPDVRVLATVASFSGFRDLSLDLDARRDGDLLLTYLQRRDDARDVVAWLGPHDSLHATTLFQDAGIARRDSAVLVDGLAAVVATTADGRVASRVVEGSRP